MLHATPMVMDAPRGGDVNRRLRAFWRDKQQAVRMAAAAATHNSYDKSAAHACTQTDDEVLAATCAATASAPVIEFVALAPVTTVSGFRMHPSILRDVGFV